MSIPRLYFLSMIIIPTLLGVVFHSFALAFFSLLMFMVYWLLVRILKKEYLSKEIAISLIIGIAVICSIYYGYIYQYGVPHWMPGRDDYDNEAYANELLARELYTWSQVKGCGIYDLYAHNSIGYLLLLERLTMFGRVFDGYHSIMPRIVNIFALNVTGLLIIDYIKKEYGGKNNDNQKSFMKLSKRLFLIITLFPNSVFLSSHVYRDAIAAMFIVISFWLSSDYMQASLRKKIPKTILLVLITLVSYTFRRMSIIFICGVFIISCLLDKNREKRNINKTIIKIIVLCLVVFGGIIIAWKVDLINQFINYLSVWENEITNSAGNGLGNIIFGISIVPFGWLLRIVYGLCLPFYSTALDVRNMLESVADFFYFLITVGTVVLVGKYIYFFRNKAPKKLLCVTLFITVGILITTSGFRHFLMIYPFLFATIECNSFDCKEKSLFKIGSCLISMLFLVSILSLKFFL